MKDKNSTILVTGGTGFLGAYLLRYLCKEGYTDIRAIKRSTSKMDLVAPVTDQIRWLEGDILDVVFLEDIMQDIDKVYHCAGFVSHSPKDKDRMNEVNGTGTANVVNACLIAGVKKLLHISSIASVGRRKDKETISESSKWERNPLNSAYAVSKFLSEQEAWRGQAEGLNTVIINPAVILGSGFWDQTTCELFKKVWDGLRFYPIGGSGFVDVRDVARMCIELMESPITNRRFIACSENLSYLSFFSQIATVLDKPVPSIKVPPLLARTAAALLNIPARLTGWNAPLTPESALLSSHTFFYDSQRSRQALNFNYLPIEETITATASQLKTAAKDNFSPMILPLV